MGLHKGTAQGLLVAADITGVTDITVVVGITDVAGVTDIRVGTVRHMASIIKFHLTYIGEKGSARFHFFGSKLCTYR